MSGPDRNASDEPKPDPEPDPELVRERIERELAALGEDPLDGSSEDDFALADGSPHADIDVATLQTLAGWAEAPDPDEPEQDEHDDVLSEFAQARVWRTIELRGKKDGDTSSVAPTRSGRPVLLGTLGTVIALLAVAAAVVLVPVLTADKPDTVAEPAVAQASTPVTAEELDVLSTQARAGLAALDRLSGEPTGTARVEALASDYAGRLEAQGQAPPQPVDPRGHQG